MKLRSQIDDLRLFVHALRICMSETELVSVAVDEISRVVSHRKPFIERGLPTWLEALAGSTSVSWVEHGMRKRAGTCLQVGIKNRAR